MPERIVWGFFLTTDGVPNPITTSEGDVQVAAVGPGVPGESRRALGIPDDLVIVTFTIRAPAYPGYTYTCDATRGDMDTSPDAPGLLWITLPGGPLPAGPLPLVLWRRRVTCDGLAVYLEARWAPGQKETIDIRGLEHDQRKASTQRAHQGIHLLRAIESHGGRPAGSSTRTREQFHADYPGAVLEAHKRRGAPPRNEDIARAMHLTLPTFQRYISLYGRPPSD